MGRGVSRNLELAQVTGHPGMNTRVSSKVGMPIQTPLHVGTDNKSRSCSSASRPVQENHSQGRASGGSRQGPKGMTSSVSHLRLSPS